MQHWPCQARGNAPVVQLESFTSWTRQEMEDVFILITSSLRLGLLGIEAVNSSELIPPISVSLFHIKKLHFRRLLFFFFFLHVEALV